MLHLERMSRKGWELTSENSMVDLRPVGPRRFVVNDSYAQEAPFAKSRSSDGGTGHDRPKAVIRGGADAATRLPLTGPLRIDAASA